MNAASAGEASAEDVDFCAATAVLDSRLLQTCWLELRAVFAHFDALNLAVSEVRELSMDCRGGGVSLSAAQTARVSKLCDLLDALPLATFPFPVAVDAVPLHSLLPDTDSIASHVAKIKTKIKMAEEMAASKKNENIRFRSSCRPERVCDLSTVREEVRGVLLAAEALERECEAKASVLGYLGSIKHVLHLPQQELAAMVAAAPSRTDLDGALEREVAAVEGLQRRYADARAADILVRIAAARREMIAIEEQMRTLWASLTVDQLRAALGEVENPLWVDALHQDFRVLLLSEDDATKRALDMLVAAGTAQNPRGFDAELLRAYWVDWKEREDWIEDSIRSEACQAAYAALRDVRGQVQRALRGLPNLLQIAGSAVERDALAQEKAATVREAFQQLADTELHSALFLRVG